MKVRLSDSELKVMDILWQEGPCTAKHLAQILRERVEWRKTTSYTIIKYCIDKGAIKRQEPNFVCHPLITRQQVQEQETMALINKLYDGAANQLIASILGHKKYSPEEIEKLRQLVEDMARGDL